MEEPINARLEALHHAVLHSEIHRGQSADDTVKTAEKFHQFLIGTTVPLAFEVTKDPD